MPRMTLAQALSVAANATTANLLAGLSYEFLPSPAHIIVGAAAAAAGLNLTLLVGNGITVVDDQAISQANRFPVLPDDIMFEDDVPAGRMLARVRNTTGAAVVLSGLFVDVTF